jgi:hypothetical protein
MPPVTKKEDGSGYPYGRTSWNILEAVKIDLGTLLIRQLDIYPVGTFVRLLNGEIGGVTRKGLGAATDDPC